MQRALTPPSTSRPNRQGAHHLWRLHLTTWLLLLATPFALGLFIWLAGKDHAVVVDALQRPYVALPLAGLVVIGVWHMALGLRTIIEDYIHGRALLKTLMALNTLFAVTVLVVSVWALMQLMLGL